MSIKNCCKGVVKCTIVHSAGPAQYMLNEPVRAWRRHMATKNGQQCYGKACCPTAPTHYRNQCWLIISEVFWHSHDGKFTGNAQDSFPWYDFFADIFRYIFLNENIEIPIKISLEFVPKGRINNIQALVQVMARHRPDDKPLSGPMMVNFPTHICATRPQWVLTHWGQVTHICVDTNTNIGSDNGLSPGRRQAIIWTNAGILLIGPLGTNFSEISIEIHIFPFKKMHLKMSCAKWRLFRLGLDELRDIAPGQNGRYTHWGCE